MEEQESDSLREDIHRALEAYANGSLSSEHEVAMHLVGLGISRVRAEKLVALVPLAFGRILISHMGKVEFSPQALVQSRSGTWTPCDLRSETIFVRALELAVDMYHAGNKRLFSPAASASAEVAAVSKLFESGGKLAGAKFTEAQFLRLTFEEWCEG